MFKNIIVVYFLTCPTLADQHMIHIHKHNEHMIHIYKHPDPKKLELGKRNRTRNRKVVVDSSALAESAIFWQYLTGDAARP